MQQVKRLCYIDNLKAFLIVLVVVGHCIQSFLPNYESNILFRFIYSFHMPLFIFVSGYVSYKSQLTWNSVGRRFKQLMIPFFAWAVVKALIKWDARMIPHIIHNPDNGLWFLHTLFFITLIMMVCQTDAGWLHLRRCWVVAGVGLLMLAIMYGLDFREWGFQSVAYFFIYYVSGFYARRIRLFEHIPANFVVIISIVFLCLVPFHSVNGMATFFSEGCNPMFGTAFRILLAFIGSIGIFALFRRFADKNSRVGNYLGVRTLGIYAIHPALLNIYLEYVGKTPEGGGGVVCASIVCALLMSLVLYELLSKNKTISEIFLGR